MKIDIREQREQTAMSTAHGDRLEQILLCLMDSHAIILHTLAHSSDPDVPRLRAANDRICELIQRLYGRHSTMLQ